MRTTAGSKLFIKVIPSVRLVHGRGPRCRKPGLPLDSLAMADWIFLDLDGTLLRDDKNVSDRTVAVLEAVRERGHRLVFATARPPRSVRRLVPAQFHGEHFLCGNGAKLLRGDETLFDLTLSVEVVQRALDVVRHQFPNLRFALEAEDRLTTNANFDDFVFGDVYHQVPGLSGPKVACNKVLFAIETVADLEPIIALLPTELSFVPTDGGKLLQIMPQGVTKGAGITRLLADCRLAGPGVFSLCFGDDLNDAAMFRACRWPVAMGNAHPDLKPLAKAVTLTNNEDGVAHFLSRRYLVEVRLSAELSAEFLDLMKRLDDELWAKNSCQQEAYHGFNAPVGLAQVAVAFAGSEAVACGAYKLRDDGRAEIKRMIVEPSARGFGISRQILRALESAAGVAGSRSLVLETSRKFVEANALYTTSGYKVIENFPPYIGMPDSLCYQKDLG